jgi:hypothetical protein
MFGNRVRGGSDARTAAKGWWRPAGAPIIGERVEDFRRRRSDQAVANSVVRPGEAPDRPMRMRRHRRVLAERHRAAEQDQAHAVIVVVHEEHGRAMRRRHDPSPMKRYPDAERSGTVTRRPTVSEATEPERLILARSSTGRMRSDA